MNEDQVPHPRIRADGDSTPPIGTAVFEMTFRVGDLPGVRDFAALQARRAGMPESAVGDYLVAVNEVATNAVTHGTSKACMRVWCDEGDLVVQIHDEGHWIITDTPGMTAPHDYSTSGMGLWVARRLAKELTLITGRTGTHLTMRFPL
ncbi:hypothetical protein GCM10009677_60540 [Sphaerisporangium rubeum]|uniref:Anti-sigma regulatory factor (Ser/Thr protein kinase) n=1 Tax=Sphaerisporangium rubeum TaxID=321317 RepID=A0A7X0IG36_9ACTN|nr:anti-sigma regulatory factor (Ser/Thr protein kinase) [Sphaerisporangium rubeum]